MKTPSLDLFQLIESMTKTEKRYFKQFAHKKDNDYLLVFDEISKMKYYDEAAILKKFRGKTFAKNFAKTKQYLHKQILKALRNYYGDQTVLTKLSEALIDVEVLFNKGLFEQCQKVILRSKKLAITFEYHHLALAFSDFEQRLFIYMANVPSMTNYIEQGYLEEQQLAEVLKNKMLYRRELDQSYLGLDYSKDSVLEHETPASFHAIMFHNKAEYMRTLRENKDNAYKVHLEEVNMFDKHPPFKQIYPMGYFFPLSALIQHFRIEKDLEKSLFYAHKAQKELEGIKSKISQKDYTQSLALIIHHELLSVMLTGQKDKIEVQKNKLNQLLAAIPPNQWVIKETAKSSALIADFITEDYSQALDSVEDYFDVLNHIKGNHVESFMGRLFRIMIHLELQNIQLLSSMIEASYQYIRTKEPSSKFALKLLNCLRKIVNSPSEQHQAIYITTQTELVELIEQDSKEKILLQKFDFMAWIEAKIQEKPLIDFLKQRNT